MTCSHRFRAGATARAGHRDGAAIPRRSSPRVDLAHGLCAQRRERVRTRPLEAASGARWIIARPLAGDVRFALRAIGASVGAALGQLPLLAGATARPDLIIAPPVLWLRQVTAEIGNLIPDGLAGFRVEQADQPVCGGG